MGVLVFCGYKKVGALRTWSFPFVSSRYRDALVFFFFSFLVMTTGLGMRRCDGVME